MSYKDPDVKKKKQKCFSAKHYAENKDKYKENQKRNKTRALDYIQSVKEKSRCQLCGNSNPIVMEFHHRNPDEKKMAISNMAKNRYSNENIQKEMDKCDILCSNCHRIHHHQERLEAK